MKKNSTEPVETTGLDAITREIEKCLATNSEQMSKTTDAAARQSLTIQRVALKQAKTTINAVL